MLRFVGRRGCFRIVLEQHISWIEGVLSSVARLYIPGPRESNHKLNFRAAMKVLLQPRRQLREHELRSLAPEVRPLVLRILSVLLQLKAMHLARFEMRCTIL